ncbi:hypothetical protein [Flavobacterium soli]|uniref:hypothetical protein n=1 Tax=Flavobacterium soli TaxID=344881 RepID=UPI0004119B4D|nr:hypothetical protein [Flavobacterium soli]
MKRSNSQKVILWFLLFFNSFVFCQQSTSEYVIITYEIDRNKDQHPTRNYYWIVPIDSLTGDRDFKKYPLYFDEFSQNDLNDCKGNKDLVLFTLVAKEDFTIGDKIKSDIEKLKYIVEDNRKKVESVVKKWTNGYTEKITIYVTPVKGDFCCSNLSSNDEKMINYKGLVYLPIGNFSFNEPFFESDKYKEIINEDYINSNYVNLSD